MRWQKEYQASMIGGTPPNAKFENKLAGQLIEALENVRAEGAGAAPWALSGFKPEGGLPGSSFSAATLGCAEHLF